MRIHLVISVLTLTVVGLAAADSGSAQQLTRTQAQRLLAAAPQFSRPSFISLYQKKYLPPCDVASMPEISWGTDRPNLTAVKIGILTLRPIIPPTLLRECIPYISASYVKEARTWQECGGMLRISIGRAKPVEVTGILAGGALGSNLAEVEFRWRLELNEIGTTFAKAWPKGSYDKTVSTEDHPETASFALYDDGWRLGHLEHAYEGGSQPTCGPVSSRWFEGRDAAPNTQLTAKTAPSAVAAQPSAGAGPVPPPSASAAAAWTPDFDPRGLYTLIGTPPEDLAGLEPLVVRLTFGQPSRIRISISLGQGQPHVVSDQWTVDVAFESHHVSSSTVSRQRGILLSFEGDFKPDAFKGFPALDTEALVATFSLKPPHGKRSVHVLRFSHQYQ